MQIKLLQKLIKIFYYSEYYLTSIYCNGISVDLQTREDERINQNKLDNEQKK